MVDHSVTIEHVFTSPTGAEVRFTIDQAANTVKIVCQFDRHTVIDLEPQDLAQFRDLFEEAGKLLSTVATPEQQ